MHSTYLEFPIFYLNSNSYLNSDLDHCLKARQERYFLLKLHLHHLRQPFGQQEPHPSIYHYLLQAAAARNKNDNY